MNLTITEILITLAAVLGLGLTYAWLYYQLVKEMKRVMEADKEQCPSLDDKSEE